MSDDIKVAKRKYPTTIRGVYIKKIAVIDHPEIYTDGYILLEDRNPEEVKKWHSRIPGECRFVKYKQIKRLYPEKETKPVKLISVHYAFITDYPIAELMFAENNKRQIIKVNAEYHLWLTSQGYTIKSTGNPNEALVLERNGRDVGLFMSIREM